MGIKQWITWCDEKMVKLGIKTDDGKLESTTQQSKSTREESKNTKEVIKDEEKVISTSNGNKCVDVQTTPLQMPTPKIKHDWYQTETQVKIKGGFR